MADFCDAVVLVAGGEAGDTILFGIHPHGAELQDLKLPAILSQTHLLVECRAAIRFDRNGSDEEQRTENDQADQRNNDIHGPLDEQIFRAGHIAADTQHGQMEHVHRPCAAHDDIAHAGDDEHVDALTDTIFQDNISLVAVDTADKNSLHAIQNT